MATFEGDRLHECALGQCRHKHNGVCVYCKGRELPWFAEYRKRVGYKPARPINLSPGALRVRIGE